MFVNAGKAYLRVWRCHIGFVSNHVHQALYSLILLLGLAFKHLRARVGQEPNNNRIQQESYGGSSLSS